MAMNDLLNLWIYRSNLSDIYPPLQYKSHHNSSATVYTTDFPKPPGVGIYEFPLFTFNVQMLPSPTHTISNWIIRQELIAQWKRDSLTPYP